MVGIRTWVDESGTIDLLKNLIRMNSVNPSLVKGDSGEAEIAEYVANYLKGIGLRARIDEVMPGRSNAIGVLKGSGGGPTLMLNGHLDTGPYRLHGDRPLRPNREGGQNLWSRLERHEGRISGHARSHEGNSRLRG